MRKKSFRYFVGDFETSVYDNQTDTEVWASACVELFTENVFIFTSIEEQFAYFKSLKSDLIVYYHNLKFDGSFWLDFLLIKEGYEQAFTKDKEGNYRAIPEKYMKSKSVKYAISEMGQWYSMSINTGSYKIIFQDSLKLLPFSLDRISKSFKTKHKKLSIEYKGERHAGDDISQTERDYISNDVLVLKEALEIMFEEGHDKLTIGSCCLSEYKNICKVSLKNALSYDEMFPDLYKIKLVNFDEKTAGDYIRKSYRGGWTYLVPQKANQIIMGGVTADVNSLYPSVMHSESGNIYPVGIPHFWKGDIPINIPKWNEKYYFIKIRTEFSLKKGYLPFIQIKHDFLYKSTACLTTSDVYDKEKKCWYRNQVELVLTCTDYNLIKEHYHLYNTKIISGCWFYSEIGIFDEYIDKYKYQKQNSEGARRELAKLFLNNLYGKLATSPDSSFKVAHIDGKKLYFTTQVEKDKPPGYIACGSAVTSYARYFTITHAQQNYHGPDKPGFIYADTDSIHCDLKPHDLIGIDIHPTDFCKWKLESQWDKAIFVRSKTYIEHVTHDEKGNEIVPYHNIKCAGMPEQCKDYLKHSFDGTLPEIDEKTSEDVINFLFDADGILIRRGYMDFKIGLSVPGKLRPCRIPGGIVLMDTPYVMRRN